MSAVAHWDQPRVVRTPQRRRHLTLVPSNQPVARVGRDEVRLTMRGRRVLAALVLATLIAAGWGAGRAFASSPSTTQLVVQPGQTLSEVAHQAYPQLPVAEAVVRLQLANDLNTQHVHPGQSLTAPR